MVDGRLSRRQAAEALRRAGARPMGTGLFLVLWSAWPLRASLRCARQGGTLCAQRSRAPTPDGILDAHPRGPLDDRRLTTATLVAVSGGRLREDACLGWRATGLSEGAIRGSERRGIGMEAGRPGLATFGGTEDDHPGRTRTVGTAPTPPIRTIHTGISRLSTMAGGHEIDSEPG